MKAAAAEQSQETGNDQIDRHDIVQQPRRHKDQDASDQCDYRSDRQMEIHLDLEQVGHHAKGVVLSGPTHPVRTGLSVVLLDLNVAMNRLHVFGITRNRDSLVRGFLGSGTAG